MRTASFLASTQAGLLSTYHFQSSSPALHLSTAISYATYVPLMERVRTLAIQHSIAHMFTLCLAGLLTNQT